jgi:hypothetical protein
MKLYTSVDTAPSANKIGYADKILLLGSCFADNIGEKFLEHYFQATINPFGTLYNPASILKAIHLSLQQEPKPYILQHDGFWHSMMHHGCFSHPDQSVLVQRCRESANLLNSSLQVASTIIVTLGTAWVYEYGGQVVANCHKLPAREFVRRRMTVDEIIDLWKPIIEQMPDKHWIFTVSPIRHIKDGLHENQLSKAILLQAIDTIVSNYRSVSYFPSFEIMLDELRDYRFYAEDMVHPSQVAVNYIWERFVDVYMSEDTSEEMRVLNQLWRDRHHRFLHPESQEANAFASRLNERMTRLKVTYPWLE